MSYGQETFLMGVAATAALCLLIFIGVTEMMKLRDAKKHNAALAEELERLNKVLSKRSGAG